jgi:hypothetical protein
MTTTINDLREHHRGDGAKAGEVAGRRILHAHLNGQNDVAFSKLRTSAPANPGVGALRQDRHGTSRSGESD